jgi:hypothetical protein
MRRAIFIQAIRAPMLPKTTTAMTMGISIEASMKMFPISACSKSFE